MFDLLHLILLCSFVETLQTVSLQFIAVKVIRIKIKDVLRVYSSQVRFHLDITMPSGALERRESSK